MTDDIARRVAGTVDQLRRLYLEHQKNSWAAHTNGTPANLAATAESRTRSMKFWADEASFRRFRKWDQTQAAGDDPLLARQAHLLHYGFAQGQRDPATIEEMTRLMKEVEDAYMNFRGRVGGEEVSNNAIERILDEETDSAVRREAWEASKQIGPKVADTIRRLAHLRNQTAHKLGYDNYHRMSLELDELDPDWLYAILGDLTAKTGEPFRRMKAELDAELGERWGVPVGELQAWHYVDPFFQRAPQTGGLDLDRLFEDQDIEGLAVRTFDGLDMDVRDLLERSDLYERERKDQHAFCTDMDREGDVRILCNLEKNARWMDTLLHELGHAVYDKYIPSDLPWLLREPSHTLTTEAMALLCGGLSHDAAWLTRVRGLHTEEVRGLVAPIERHRRREALIFARWVMVMVNFERAMYEDPDRDLDTLWWDLVENYQLVPRPDGRSMPDWATKYHVALAPAYYQNYLLGQMVSIQWQKRLQREVGGIVDQPGAGQFFREQVFAPGDSRPWNEALEYATGEKLNIDYYVQRYLGD